MTILVSPYFTDSLINEMVNKWENISWNTYKHWVGLRSGTLGAKKTALRLLETNHPIVFSRLRAASSI